MKIKHNLKLALIIMGPFYVGWLAINYAIPKVIITQDQRAVILLSFIVCWLAYAGCYGVYQERQASKHKER